MPDRQLLSDKQEFVQKLVFLKEEAFRVGMYQTGHILDAAVKKSGWELADIQKEAALMPGGEHD